MQPEGLKFRIDICYLGYFNSSLGALKAYRFTKMSMNPEMGAATTTCGNCRTAMPKELRFCRNCGFRLGEGSAEYTETLRLNNAHAASLMHGGSPSAGNFGAPVRTMSASPGGVIRKRRRRMSGMSWMFIGLLIFFVVAAGFTAVIKPIRQNIAQVREAIPARSYAGVNSFDTTEGGVTFDNVEPPGSPADKAGLVGGDVITTVDGQTIHTDDEIMDLLGRTPIGKTLEVVYIRDGETRHTQLTTISKAEFDHLAREFRDRPEGRGRFGFDDDETERVPIPGTKMFGVRLDEISASLPADMAGIKQGDVVIEFDGIPIRTPEELKSRVIRALPYNTIKVVVMRGGERLEIPVKMGKQ